MNQGELLRLLIECREMHERALIAYYNDARFHQERAREAFEDLATLVDAIRAADLYGRALKEKACSIASSPA